LAHKAEAFFISHPV